MSSITENSSTISNGNGKSLFDKSTESNSKVVEFGKLNTIRDSAMGKTIVHCHGVFDVLHIGHLAYFESAKKFGDILVVTLTQDKFVNKGPGRPYFNSNVRANMLAALEAVDYVAINTTPTAVSAIEELKPDFYVKGPDYRNKDKDVTGAIYDEERAVQKFGGELVFTDDQTESSSSILNKYFVKWSDRQLTAIETVKKLGGMGLIHEVFEEVAKLKVRVIGEPIVDTYVFCHPESISSKSPSISAKFLYQEDYAGGSLAIANHLANFVDEISCVFTHGDEPYFNKMLKEKMDPKVKVEAIALKNVPTPRKTRYIGDNTGQRLFELTDLRADQWANNSAENFLTTIKSDTDRDCTVIADFGHGLFEGDVLSSIQSIPEYLALNVQTNSSNFGFNPFTKYQNFSFMSIDTREARVAYHDRFATPMQLARRIRTDYEKASMCVTLGPDGSIFFPRGSEKELSAPAFATNIVDATGAGDAFFAITAMLAKVDCPEEIVPFVGNVFAGLKTKILGNKSSVSKQQLIKAIEGILK